MFSSEQIKLLVESGWNRCDSIRAGLEDANLPVPTASYLEEAVSVEQWDEAEAAINRMRDRFADVQFASQTTYGVLLVPDPTRLDTRGAVDPAIRRDQLAEGALDFVDDRLPAGKLVTEPGVDWTLVATVTGTAGVHLGSYRDICNDLSVEAYTVREVDTRDLMVRQIWGARVLQCGGVLPDSNARKSWTFTLFPGEELTDGCAASGTVLHERVRFRLGRPDRGISSTRVCPAVVIG